MGKTSIKWNDKEVDNPIARAFMLGAAGLASVATILFLFWVFIFIIPILLIVHPILVLFKRKGFIRTNADHTFDIKMDKSSFERKLNDILTP